MDEDDSGETLFAWLCLAGIVLAIFFIGVWVGVVS